ncbi:protein tolkin-like [Cotesia typhae]|uniref:protein tolkin-like n=1 Tax=Cotesia typhae TaxID=2053667 RepID=UPI003D68ADDB
MANDPRNKGRSKISLNDGCDEISIFLHELGHVLGLHHEHEHPDRDQYVFIKEYNVERGYRQEFGKFSYSEVDTLNRPYDYWSIMHYPEDVFARSKYVKTIVPIQYINGTKPRIGNQVRLSDGDISAVNKLYKCSGRYCGNYTNLLLINEDMTVKYVRTQIPNTIISNDPITLQSPNFPSNYHFFLLFISDNAYESVGFSATITTSRDNETHQTESLELNDKFNRSKKSVVLKDTEFLWDDGIIPYEFEDVYTGPQRRLILQAMRHWEEASCITFVKRNEKLHRSYLFFTKINCRCCSVIGRVNNGKGIISIDDDCGQFGTILHELGHAIGFFHEHEHPDRDLYVKINFENIKDDDNYLFTKLDLESVSTLDQPYNYDSIMHYSSFSSSKGSGKKTIVPLRKINGTNPDIGQRIKLSEGDISAANLLYKCSKCSKTFSSPSGILIQNNSMTTYNNCRWTIRAAAGEQIKLDIKSLDIYNSTDCINEFLEIKSDYQENGIVIGLHCGRLDAVRIIGSNWLTVTFAGIKSKESSLGFSIQYQSLCGGYIQLKSNETYYLESPNYPDNYKPYKQCEWYITAPYKHYLLIKFDYFELEDSKMCKNDFLEAREGRNENAPLIGTYCGRKENFKIASLMRKVYLMFFSNESKQAGGFSAAISAVPI